MRERLEMQVWLLVVNGVLWTVSFTLACIGVCRLIRGFKKLKSLEINYLNEYQDEVMASQRKLLEEGKEVLAQAGKEIDETEKKSLEVKELLGKEELNEEDTKYLEKFNKYLESSNRYIASSIRYGESQIKYAEVLGKEVEGIGERIERLYEKGGKRGERGDIENIMATREITLGATFFAMAGIFVGASAIVISVFAS